MIKQEDVYQIGRMGKAHGLKGEINLQFTDDVWDRAEADHIICLVDGILVPFFLEEYRFRSDDLAIIKFEGVDTAEEARPLVNCYVFFPKSQTTDDEGMSLSQLTGFHVIDASTQHDVGTVTSVDTSTANTLIEVETADGERRLIPLAEELIAGFDPQQQHITLHIPEGLLEL